MHKTTPNHSITITSNHICSTPSLDRLYLSRPDVTGRAHLLLLSECSPLKQKIGTVYSLHHSILSYSAKGRSRQEDTTTTTILRSALIVARRSTVLYYRGAVVQQQPPRPFHILIRAARRGATLTTRLNIGYHRQRARGVYPQHSQPHYRSATALPYYYNTIVIIHNTTIS